VSLAFFSMALDALVNFAPESDCSLGARAASFWGSTPFGS
jgi:hypothetical protein